MLDILFRSVARAGGIEIPDHVRIVPPAKPRKSVLRRLAGAFSRYRARKSTFNILSRLDDRALADVGLRREVLRDIAGDMVHLRAAANESRSIPAAANDSIVVIDRADAG